MTDITISWQTKSIIKKMAQSSGENYKKIESNLYERVKIYVKTCGFNQEDAEQEAINDLEYLLNE